MIDLPSHSRSRRMRTTRLPQWLVKPFRQSREVHELKSLLRSDGLHTVCEEARCPNLGECWERKTATFMILGDVCTRHCGFCSVNAGKPAAVDPDEPTKIARMVSHLGLKHVVITCVARDDLPDCGAAHFAGVIEAIRGQNNHCLVEVLTTDFQLNQDSMAVVCQAHPDVFNHNIETVERLSDRVRHRASYQNSLEFLRRVGKRDGSIKTKSGIMVGLGETADVVRQAMRDLRSVDCRILTIGQYLQPTSRNLPVIEFVPPEMFEEYGRFGYELGFESVASGPFVRSSYHADAMVHQNYNGI